MSPTVTGFIGIAVLLLFFLVGMPVGVAMALVGFAGFSLLVSPTAGLNILAKDVFIIFSSYGLTVIPLFTFMGTIAFYTGASRRLYSSAFAFLGGVRGGLAMATTAACAGFAAVTGSTTASAAAMGRVTLPEMRRYGYDDALATGCVAASGSLGILIPPSTIFIVYGIMTEQSIGKLFLSGIFPGLVLTALFIATIYIVCRRNPALGPPGEKTNWKQKIATIPGTLEAAILFVLVMGGLFAGWFTPSEAAAVGAAGAILIALAMRQLTWQGFLSAIRDTLRISAMVFLIVAGATVFGHFLAVTKIPFDLARWADGFPLPPLAIMGLIVLIYVIGGCFMDALALITLTIPIFYPVVVNLGFDPIWFGVIIVLVTEMGVITPPVGVNVYVIKGVAEDVPLTTIFRGVFPFTIAILVNIGILMAFPEIAIFLPSLMK